MDEPKTAILHETAAPSKAQTRAHVHTTVGQTVALPLRGGEAVPRVYSWDKRLLAVPVLFALIAVGGYFGYRYFTLGGGEINSIAVLPFQNRNSDADSDYLSDGLAESLIYRLSQLPKLKVTPASAVMRWALSFMVTVNPLLCRSDHVLPKLCRPVIELGRSVGRKKQASAAKSLK